MAHHQVEAETDNMDAACPASADVNFRRRCGSAPSAHKLSAVTVSCIPKDVGAFVCDAGHRGE